MFTGIIQHMGRTVSLADMPPGKQLVVHCSELSPSTKIGDSIAINGVCLTVTHMNAGCWVFQIGPETLDKTTLGHLMPDEKVNLEEPLRMGDPLGGHWVQGHVDGVGLVIRREPQEDWETVRFLCDPALAGQLVPKGSVTVDGVSLTVVETSRDEFSVALIPHTLAHTTLGLRNVGDRVNLEVDILSKYTRAHLNAMGITSKEPNS